MSEEDPPSEDVASALIEGLADEGEYVDDGGFTLDPAAALAKLRAHQLDDPHAYLLLLVEAAWLAGHRRSEGGARISLGSTTSVTFRGLALAHGVLPDVFTVALVGNVDALEGDARTQARILQLLGLAANAALALEPKQLVITAIDAERRATRVTVTPAGTLTVEEPTDETMQPGTVQFSLHGSGLGRKRNQAELALLRERCRHTTLPIWVDEELLSRGLAVDLKVQPGARVGEAAALIQTDVRYRGEVIGVAGHTTDPSASPQVVFVNRGVAIVEPLRERGGGLQAVVEIDLPVDLSRKQLVEGAELEAIRFGIRAAVTRLAPPAEPPRPAKPSSAGPFVVAGVIGVLVLGVMSLALSSMSSRSSRSSRSTPPPRPTPAKVMKHETQRLATQAQATSKQVETSALEIGCYGSFEGKSCMQAAERTQNPVLRDPLLIRGCTVQHDPDACQALVAAARAHVRDRTDLAPVGLALVQSCLGVAGPDCVEAARHLRLGDYPSETARSSDTYYLLRQPIPEVSADELLERGCKAKVAEACAAIE